MGFVKSSASIVAQGLQGLAQLAAHGSEALPAADPTPPTITLDPDELARNLALKLTDLRIPNSLKEWLSPSLTPLKFEIETKYSEGIGNPKRSYDVIQNVAGHRTLLHIPSKVLESNSTWDTVASMITFGMGFSNQPLVILSEGLDVTAVNYRVIMPHNLGKLGLTWEFIPWKNLGEIRPMPEHQQVFILPNILKLEDLINQAQNLPETPISVREISEAEITELANIIGRLDYFIDNKTKAWRTVLQDADLEKVLASVDIDGVSMDVARRLINHLNTMKPIQAHPEDQVLGLFLCRILTIGEVNAAGIAYIESLLKKYTLVTSRK